MYHSGTGFDVGLDPTFMLAYDLANLTTQLLKVITKVHKIEVYQQNGSSCLTVCKSCSAIIPSLTNSATGLPMINIIREADRN